MTRMFSLVHKIGVLCVGLFKHGAIFSMSEVQSANSEMTVDEMDDEATIDDGQAESDNHHVIDGGQVETKDNFPLQLQNLPKFITTKQVKNMLKKLDVPCSSKVCVVKFHAFISFSSESERLRGIQVLDGFEWKGRVITARPAINKQNKERTESETNRKPLTEAPSLAKMVDAVTPLASMPYNEQLKWKQDESHKTLANLTKQLGITGVKDIKPATELVQPVLASPVQKNYRNKCEFSIGFGSDGNPAVGFVVPGSFIVFPVQECTNIPETMKKCVAVFQSFVSHSELPCFSEKTRTGFWKMLTLRAFSFDLLMIVTVHSDVKETDSNDIKTVKQQLIETFCGRNLNEGYRLTSLYMNRNLNQSDKPNYEHLAGAPYVYESLLGLRFRVSPGAFFQTNTKAAEVLYETIGRLAGADNESVLLDLCCGTGTIGLSLAKKFKAVIGVELCAEAVHDARQNAKSNSITNCRFVIGKAEDAFREFKYFLPNDIKSLDNVNIVGVLDPPRPGLHQKLISALRRTQLLNRIVYVSCDPKAATKNFVDLCRPISNRFIGKPFSLVNVVPVDMFPQTKHYEWVMLFER